MSADSSLGSDISLHLSLLSVQVDKPSIRPRLLFAFELSNSLKQQHNRSYGSSDPAGINFGMMASEVRQVTSKGDCYIGHLIPRNALNSQPINSRNEFLLCLDSNILEISEIERLRESKDLQLIINLSILSELANDSEVRTNNSFQIRYRIPKSDWVESFLPTLGLKTVSLIEIPQLTDPAFQETISILNDAWRQYSMGEYARVFSDCRKVIELVGQHVKDRGFISIITDKETQERCKVPDWKKFVDNEEIGDAISTINRKLFRLCSTGAHGIRNISREDADFVMMTTHALVNLIIKKANHNE